MSKTNAPRPLSQGVYQLGEHSMEGAPKIMARVFLGVVIATILALVLFNLFLTNAGLGTDEPATVQSIPVIRAAEPSVSVFRLNRPARLASVGSQAVVHYERRDGKDVVYAVLDGQRIPIGAEFVELDCCKVRISRYDVGELNIVSGQEIRQDMAVGLDVLSN